MFLSLQTNITSHMWLGGSKGSADEVQHDMNLDWTRECKPGAYFSNPGLRVWPHSNPGTRVWHMVGHLSVADSQIVYYKQLRGGRMEVQLAIDT